MNRTKENTIRLHCQKMFWYWVIIVLLLGLLVLTAQCCNSETARANENLSAATDTAAYFKNRLNGVTATASTYRLKYDEMRKQFLAKDAEMKAMTKEFVKVHSVSKFGNLTKLPDIAVRFDTSASGKYHDSLHEFEKNGTVIQKWYSFAYNIMPDSLKLSGFTIPTETTVMTGKKRKWFLGKETLTTDIANTNPYITIQNIRSAEVVLQEPWYRKWYLWLIAGFAGGLLIK